MGQFQNWMRNITDKYEVDVSKHHEGNQFIFDEFLIKDPRGSGLSFKLAVNKSEEASLISIIDFEPGRINIAEGYSEADILGIADKILTGSYESKKGPFGKIKLGFNTGIGEVVIKSQKKIDEKFRGETMRYSEKH